MKRSDKLLLGATATVTCPGLAARSLLPEREQRGLSEIKALKMPASFCETLPRDRLPR
jgi:hypothetical protein